MHAKAYGVSVHAKAHGVSVRVARHRQTHERAPGYGECVGVHQCGCARALQCGLGALLWGGGETTIWFDFAARAPPLGECTKILHGGGGGRSTHAAKRFDLKGA